MSGFVIPFDVVLQLLPEDSSTRLGQLGTHGVHLECVSTLEHSGTCFTLCAHVGDRRVTTGAHPWISEPLVEELCTLLDLPLQAPHAHAS